MKHWIFTILFIVSFVCAALIPMGRVEYNVAAIFLVLGAGLLVGERMFSDEKGIL